jgi:hypothetical protein
VEEMKALFLEKVEAVVLQFLRVINQAPHLDMEEAPVGTLEVCSPVPLLPFLSLEVPSPDEVLQGVLQEFHLPVEVQDHLIHPHLSPHIITPLLLLRVCP